MDLRALWAQVDLCVFFWEDPLPFSILDIYKCPFFKTQFTFGKILRIQYNILKLLKENFLARQLFPRHNY